MRILRSLRQTLAGAILLQLAVPISVASAMCSDMVVNAPLHGRDLFAHYEMKIKWLALNKEAVKELVSRDRVEEFWLRTWPDLQSRARAEEMSVAEMLEEPLLLAKLYNSEVLSSKDLKMIAVLQNGLIKDLEALEKLKPGGKLKANHWERIPRVMAGLYSVLSLAFEIEKVTLDEPTFDPFGKISAKVIMRALESMDDSALDAMSLSVEESRRVDTPVAALNPTLAAPEVITPPVVPQDSTPPPLTIQPPGPTNQLLVVLKERFPLSNSIVYQASNPRGQQFTIEIASEIVDEDSGPEKHTIRRLLKSILHGTGGKNGIKTLFDIGPKIIELKAHTSGHKRIIGCLDGRNLRLLMYGPMPTTRAGYFDVIPANLCK